jgi:hypothetical protein
MNKPQLLYSVSETETTLYDTPEEAIETAYDNGWEITKFPFPVFEFRRMDPTMAIFRVAGNALEEILCSLDEEYADMDGNPTEPTTAMLEAKDALAKAILQDYVPYNCEPTGNTTLWSEEEFRKVVGDA